MISSQDGTEDRRPLAFFLAPGRARADSSSAADGSAGAGTSAGARLPRPAPRAQPAGGPAVAATAGAAGAGGAGAAVAFAGSAGPASRVSGDAVTDRAAVSVGAAAGRACCGAAATWPAAADSACVFAGAGASGGRRQPGTARAAAAAGSGSAGMPARGQLELLAEERRLGVFEDDAARGSRPLPFRIVDGGTGRGLHERELLGRRLGSGRFPARRGLGVTVPDGLRRGRRPIRLRLRVAVGRRLGGRAVRGRLLRRRPVRRRLRRRGRGAVRRRLGELRVAVGSGTLLVTGPVGTLGPRRGGTLGAAGTVRRGQRRCRQRRRDRPVGQRAVPAEGPVGDDRALRAEAGHAEPGPRRRYRRRPSRRPRRAATRSG